MTSDKSETRSCGDRIYGLTTQKEFIIYICSKSNCLNPNVTFIPKIGFNNPYSHLQTSYARGQKNNSGEEALRQLFYMVLITAAPKGGTLKSHLILNALSEYEQAVHVYIRLDMVKSMPLYYITDP